MHTQEAKHRRNNTHEYTTMAQHHNQATNDEARYDRQPRTISVEDEMMFGPGRTFEDVDGTSSSRGGANDGIASNKSTPSPSPAKSVSSSSPIRETLTPISLPRPFGI
ncbi:hypothetical protein ACHAXA_002183 [Cyclostephanos tholiformis]|uniref:Uncharacterized protein n=1 Tax=Cyclostephanos tholiformis TaxID=382380 RepID=A0ABD3RVL6_9STRA